MKKRKDGRYLKVITIDGKRLYFYSSENTEKKAEKDIQRQILEFSEKKERGKLFEEVADEWEENHYPKVEYSTARRYSIFLKYTKAEFKDRYIKDITPVDIERHIEYFTTKNYSSKTIKDQLSVIRLVFKYAYVKGYISAEPTRYIVPPKGQPSKKREPLTDSEIEIVKNSIDCTFGFFAYFTLYTGLRKGEALALQYRDIDIANNEIYIRKSLYYVGDTPHIKAPKTENGIRTVILPDTLKDKIPKGKPDEYIFSVDGTKPISASSYERRWNDYQAETGLTITAHQLRHTYATILFEAGIDEKDTQHLMGHSDISITRNIYTHIRSRRLKETANKLNAYID